MWRGSEQEEERERLWRVKTKKKERKKERNTPKHASRSRLATVIMFYYRIIALYIRLTDLARTVRLRLPSFHSKSLMQAKQSLVRKCQMEKDQKPKAVSPS